MMGIKEVGTGDALLFRDSLKRPGRNNTKK